MSTQSQVGQTNLAPVQDTDHRINDTIQSVASLLMLQAGPCAAPEASAALEDAARRPGVQTLAEALRATFSDRVALRVVADHVMVESRLAISLALLVNEAVTNAFKHAYPDGQSGEIFVRVARAADRGLRIGIQEDGVGFSSDVRQGALGLALMRTFASQLGGHLAVLSDEGTTIQLTMLDGAASHPNGHPVQIAASHDLCASTAESNQPTQVQNA